ncbi:hypothetical protein Agub_g6829, partial [Astrephomene gubernaculifera]
RSSGTGGAGSEPAGVEEAGKKLGEGERSANAEASGSGSEGEKEAAKEGGEGTGLKAESSSSGSSSGSSSSTGGSTSNSTSSGSRSERSSGGGDCRSEAWAKPVVPSGDPRLMVDAYGMTPYSIACKRKDRRRMLVELLDPATDFCANEGEEQADGQAAAGAGSDSAGGAGASLLGSRSFGRRRGLGGGRGDEDDDEDSDSEGGVAGPLLLWEGVELVQGIAADPASFFALQQTAPLLQPLQPEEPAATAAAAAAAVANSGGVGANGGAGRRRSSAISAVGLLRRGSGGSEDTGGADGGRISSGRAGSRAVLTEEAVPDCFLCPLTCEVFRDPVVAADGVTYEREAIERHLRHVATSPLTKQRLASKVVYPNSALKRAIEHWELLRAGGGGGAAAGGSGSESTGLLGRR